MNDLLVNKINDLCKLLSNYNFLKNEENLKDQLDEQLYSFSSSMDFNKNETIKIYNLQEEYNLVNHINNQISYYNSIDQLLNEELNDNELRYIIGDIEKLIIEIDNYIMRDFLNDEMSQKDCILSIHSGAGGIESEDWAGMLMRMYLFWSSKNKYNVDIINIMHSKEVNNGIKWVDIFIKGKNAYGLLKNETGVHRLVRKSPFSSTQSRHTSFASIKVMPDVNDDIDIKIDEKNDVRIDTLRGTGAGGQHRNKTDSCVRLTHLETGIVVMCQSDRSQHRNKANAFKILKSKLYELELQKQKDENKINYKTINDISWGHQIRSYVLHPEQRVKDHRTNYTENDFNNVLNGNIDSFIYKSILN